MFCQHIQIGFGQDDVRLHPQLLGSFLSPVLELFHALEVASFGRFCCSRSTSGATVPRLTASKISLPHKRICFGLSPSPERSTSFSGRFRAISIKRASEITLNTGRFMRSAIWSRETQSSLKTVNSRGEISLRKLKRFHEAPLSFSLGISTWQARPKSSRAMGRRAFSLNSPSSTSRRSKRK